jgi:putative peptidoglycan lipid II flippase
MLALFVRDVYVASVFGRSQEVDAYFLALMVPVLSVQLLGSGLQSSVVPAYTKVIATGDAARKRRFVESLTFATLLLSVGVVAFIWLVGSPGLRLLSKDHGVEQSTLTQHLLDVLLLLAVFEGVATLWAALLQAEDRLVEPIVSRIAVPGGAVLGMVLFARYWGVHALAWGTVAGYLVQLVWRGANLARAGGSIVPRWHPASAELRAVFRQYLPVMIGGGIGALSSAVDNSMAALSPEPAAVSALTYGSRLVTVLTTAGSVAVSAAVLPHLSRLAVENRYAEIRRLSRWFVCAILSVGVPAASLLIFFSDDLVRLIFERGQFSAGDTALVSKVQALFAMQVPVFVVGVFFARVISSMGRNDLLLYITIASVTSNALLNYVLMQFIGVAGIALSTSVVYLLTALCAGGAARFVLAERLRIQPASQTAPAGMAAQ